MKKSAKKSAAQSCDINFSKLRNRSVKVFLGAEQSKSVEIIGSRGKYAIVTDSNNENLAKLRGKTGSLKEVKKEVASYLCGMEVEKMSNEERCYIVTLSS